MMWRQVRDAVTLIVFLGLVAVSLAASVEAIRQGLPESQLANPSQRLQWLAEHDVRQLSRDGKLRFVHRFEEDFARNFAWQPEIDRFTDAQWARFEANFTELMRTWFLHKVETWSSLSPEQRNYYIDEQFPFLMSWRPLERNAASETPRGRRRRGQLNRFSAVAQRIQQSIAAEAPEKQVQIEAFAQAVIERAVLRLTVPGQVGPNPD